MDTTFDTTLNYSQENEKSLQKIYNELGFTDIKFMVNPSEDVSVEMCVEHALEMLTDLKNRNCKNDTKFKEFIVD